MNKRLQIILNKEAWDKVEKLCTDANADFANGKVSYADAINEMILCSKVDIETLRSKNINIKKSLRNMASMDNLDIEQVIERLVEIKKGAAQKTKKTAKKTEGETCQKK